MDLDAKIARLAEAATVRYCKRCWWASAEDIRQEALWAMHNAKRRYDSNRGTPVGAYLWTAAVRWLRGILWSESSPVSGRCEELYDLLRAPLDAIAHRGTGDESADEQLDKARCIHRMREELFALARTVGASEYVQSALDNDDARFNNHMTDAVLQFQRSKFLAAAKTDRILYDLWRE